MRTSLSRTLASCVTLACTAAAMTTAVAGIVTTNAGNPAPITIVDNAPASPYPSPIAVSGLRGNITGITVTLNGFSHTWPNDVDVMMVAPDGQQFMLMSDAGDDAGTDASNVTLTFNAASTTSLSAVGAPVSGTYLPTNLTDLEGGDGFVGAPAGTPGLDLTRLYGPAAAQNGVWQLYVVDDFATDAGTFAGGWTLSITQDTFTTCAAEGYTAAKLTLCRQVCEIQQSPSRFSGLFKLYSAIYRSTPPCVD